MGGPAVRERRKEKKNHKEGNEAKSGLKERLHCNRFVLQLFYARFELH